MDPDHWDGEIPEGDLLALSWSPPTVIFYECNGPLTDRLVEFLFQGVGDVWGRLGRSLEDCLRWQLAAFNIGAFTVRTFPHDDTGIIVDLATDIDREDLLDKLRPHLAASGATPAYFGVYDPPPGYTSPGR
jgi:hypothetical protein